MAVNEYHDLVPEEPWLDTLPVKSVADIQPKSPENSWLIRDLWARSGVGVIGAQAKSAKTWLGLDLAISVASETNCLGRFEVDYPGRALIYMAEDSPTVVRSRIGAICAHRCIDVNSLMLDVVTAASLRLDLEEDRLRLANTIQSLQPRMLLLDPLIRLHHLEENSATDISGLLGYLRELQRAFDLSIVLVHHTSKKHYARHGQALRGSSDLHAFGDSNLYLSRNDDQITLTIEHRASRPPDPLTLQLVSNPDGTNTHLEIIDGRKSPGENPPSPASLEDSVLSFLSRAGSARFRSQIRSALKVNNQRLGQALSNLEDMGSIRRTANGWHLAGPSNAISSGPCDNPSGDPNQLNLIG